MELLDLFEDFIEMELDIFLALEDVFSANLPLASLTNLLCMELLDLFMEFVGMDLDLFLASHSSKSFTNFTGELLLFIELLDLFMDFLGMDLDLFLLVPEDICCEELTLFIELLRAFFLGPSEADIF